MSKSDTFPYKAFKNFIFRTPSFALSTGNQYVYNKVFSEALYLASPDLYEEYQIKKEFNIDDKVFLSIIKYLSRARSRCTPFGLFAGCSVGSFSEETKIELPTIESYNRKTRLDLNYICALVQHIESLADIRQRIKYYPNSSIYPIANKLRYVEYFMDKSKRIHSISSVDTSSYLQTILNTSQYGATIDELSSSIIDEYIDIDDARNFVEELINAQLLKSELEVAVTSGNHLDTLIEKLDSIEPAIDIKSSLCKIKILLENIDSLPIGDSRAIYQLAIDVIERIGVYYNKKYLFQADMYKPCKIATLSHDIYKKMTPALNFLNKISRVTESQELAEFKKEFFNRFEDAEASLSLVMDTELGIGYPVSYSSDINALIDDIIIPSQKNKNEHNYIMTPLQSVLVSKYIDCIKTNLPVIELLDQDFTNLAPNWNDTPPTIGIFCSIFNNDDIYIKSFGGCSSAANLLGRFGHLDKSIEQMCLDITKKESDMYPDSIIAEIVHLPESRIGNIISRPIYRDYEIPYLCKSGVDEKCQIQISDITVSIRNNKLFLRSIKHNKQIIPRLTTAHNYSYNSLPIYKFLCDIQNQEANNNFRFHWGEWAYNLEYKPRVIYKNFILNKASWIIKEKEIEQFRKESNNEYWLKSFLQTKLIPIKFVIPEGDNELLIDSEDLVSANVFYHHIRNKEEIMIEEFLFTSDNSITKGFTNEFIINFYRN